jgi:imidazolonepropionase
LTALIHARIATCDGQGIGLIDDGFIRWRGETIDAVGPMSAWPRADRLQTRDPEAGEVVDVQGALVTPGLIDCHTHLVYAGDRAREFEMRLEGASYEDIARAGGGIVSTVRATRAASESVLLDAARARVADLQADGVTTVEVKSGYGLDVDTECRLLRLARRLATECPIDVRTSFLGAHALPPEFAGRPDAYVDLVVDEMLPAVARDGLADAVDAFCEGIAFDPAQTRRVFERARALGLPVRLHADQLSDLGGGALAAEFGALSADHLEHASLTSIEAMARAGTVAVLLPGAFYFIRETRLPPIAAMRRAGVAMAVATDHNPGTSPCGSLLLMLNMACTLFRLTPAEALLGVTCHAARALGLERSHGRLRPGAVADIALWDAQAPADLAYEFGRRPLRRLYKRGRAIDAAGGQGRDGRQRP